MNDHKSWRALVLQWLQKNVSEHRIQHILGVEQTCIDLADIYQVDSIKAGKAGLLHDLAKFFPPKKLLHLAKKNKIEIDSVCKHNPHLLHADVSAIVAQKEFAIADPEILDAIANHTLGTPRMSKLSCIVFIADAIEPSRGNTPELQALRKIATQNLYKCTWQTSDYSLKYLINSQKTIHPRTILTRNWALKKAKK
ncbi:putative HD superfamily hydrolase of NAD metabolism [Xenococcus sp. PCC 7305]|uniref:bis(5'-nucleosyl)-tetraphosphatase (symmetrical) YqeK n=1 Tax=Xenococcus sp. PCC 7305 TaxID=102125 RepID=UPI0002ABEB4F|nr:bis(5'-nucleosyl)-tetraphosphatase (symmetrical) YqeK [Xenococcus sp. PCC 7305]ELS03540.1 putative HD superfamily hydrolase of NAD metabolism [Xenococcus sp. PCC 7305]